MGGVATKYNRAKAAANEYWQTELISEISQRKSSIVMVEPLWFVLDTSEEEFVRKVTDFINLKCTKKIIYGTEMCMLKWDNKTRESVIESADVITTCCRYHRNMFTYADVPTKLLCDTVPEDVFYPAQKERSVMCVGQIAWWKNSETITEVFSAIKKKDSTMKTIYIGDSGLWAGEPYPNSEKIEANLTSAVDEHIESESVTGVANRMNRNTFYLHGAYHDTYSESQAEAAMAGNVTFGLGHPLLDERPCFTGFENIDDLVEKMVNMDEDVIIKEGARARKWAVENYSYPVFRKQLSQFIQVR